MKYFRARKQLWHTGHEAQGLDPIVPVGHYCEITHLSPDEIELLIGMEAITPVTDDEYRVWQVAQERLEALKVTSTSREWNIEGVMAQVREEEAAAELSQSAAVESKESVEKPKHKRRIE